MTWLVIATGHESQCTHVGVRKKENGCNYLIKLFMLIAVNGNLAFPIHPDCVLNFRFHLSIYIHPSLQGFVMRETAG